MLGKLICGSGKGKPRTQNIARVFNAVSESNDKATNYINIGKPLLGKLSGGDVNSGGLKVFFTNARSVRNKREELCSYMVVENIDIACITESWISEQFFGDFISDYEFPNYNLYLYQRKHKKGGGILVYVKQKYKSSYIDYMKNGEAVESLWIDVTFGKRKDDVIRIGAFYRPPSQDQGLDQAMLAEIGAGVTNRCIILCDFNLPRLPRNCKLSADSTEQAYLDCFGDLFLEQLVQTCTRGKEILDLVLTNDHHLIRDVRVGESLGESDHNIIRFTVNVHYTLEENITMVPNLSRGDYAYLRTILNSVDWVSILGGNDAHGMWNIFKGILAEAQSYAIPMKQLRISKKSKPGWLSKDIRNLITEKKIAFKQLKFDASTISLHLYRAARKKLKRVIRKNKRMSELNMVKSCMNDMNAFFRFYRFNKKRAGIGPIVTNGVTLTEDKDMVKAFSDHFVSVFTKDTACSDLSNQSCGNSGSDIVSCGSPEISLSLIRKHLRALKITKAAGPDEIHARVLNETEAEIALPLFLIFKRSLHYAEIPMDWKAANIVPIFKGGSKQEVKNYRPVSLTSVVSKLFEKIIKDHIQRYLDRNRLIRNTQHGFMPGKSCLTNLLEFLSYCTEEVDEGHCLDVIYLDFNKAFDKVSHNGLLIQLQRHGVSDIIINWIRVWLCQRKQRVLLNGAKSHWVNVVSGVPQGSVLGPILFNIFINNIELNLGSRVFKFADDMKLVNRANDSGSKQMQADLDTLVAWAKTWHMSFNYSKCKVLHVGKNNIGKLFYMDGQALESIIEEKDLGIKLSNDLKWAKQSREAAMRAFRMLGAINRNVTYKSKYVIRKLYCAYVRPHLEYCIQAWSPYHQKDTKLLERVQRRATKLVKGFQHLSYEERLKKLNLKSLSYRRHKADMVQVFKCIKGIDKLNFGNMFKFSNTGKTRGHKYKLQKQKFKTGIRQNFFSQRVINSWNNLPSSVINSSSLFAFKKNFDAVAPKII